MKSKTIILIAISAVVTLSFTFASVNKTDKKEISTSQSDKSSNAPAGGFVSEKY